MEFYRQITNTNCLTIATLHKIILTFCNNTKNLCQKVGFAIVSIVVGLVGLEPTTNSL